MEPLKADDFDKNLTFVLRKIIECKKVDNAFVDKFLAHINREFCSKHDNFLEMPNLLQWLLETFQKWKQNSPSVSETAFICRFTGILAQNEQRFYLLQNHNALNELVNTLEFKVLQKTALKSVYISFLSDLLNHSSGYEWIKFSNQWKTVTHLYFSNSNLYVEREGLNFLKKFMSKAAFDDEVNEKLFQEIFSPIKDYNETNVFDKNFCLNVLLLLRLMESLLKMSTFFTNPLFCLKLAEVFDIQRFLSFLLENCKEEIILDEASILKVMFFVVCYKDKKELLSLEDVPDILDVFYAMLKRNQFNGITKLAKYCHLLWSEMKKEIQCESKTGIHFIMMQLVPAIICIKPPDTALCDIYIQKVFSLTTVKAQKFCYLLRDEIRNKVSSKPKNLALKGVLSVISNTECLKLEEAVIIFQAMAYILKSFISDDSSISSVKSVNYTENEFQTKTSLCVEDTSLLTAVLNALCIFIEKFKINWRECLESLCLLKITCVLLKNTDLSSTVVVQVFLLVKLAILNFLSPDLALLLNDTKDSTFDCLMPQVFKRLYDPNWEIRDSSLEVITAIAELSESKYPAFQQLLVENDLYSLIVDIMEGDSESYVRASAIQALAAMTKTETLLQFLINIDLPSRIIKLLQNESEGIVRREAALLIKQIYLTLNDPHNELVTTFYEVMGYSAVYDLHWEVRVNSLIFWEAVIQCIIADQGMIDGSFPKVTFSKEHKKIVNLTKNEVKLRLNKVLEKLSEIGCLYVLLTSLNDDCDISVIEKSAQILSDLINVLKQYEVMESCQDLPICDRVKMKRKNTIEKNCEKRKLPSLTSINNSNGVLNEKILENFNNEKSADSNIIIDEIVNERDINLLLGVLSQNERTVNFEKKILLQQIKPEAFLLKIQNFELEKFVENKQKWMLNMEVDLKSFVNEISNVNLTDETNIMDCY